MAKGLGLQRLFVKPYSPDLLPYLSLTGDQAVSDLLWGRFWDLKDIRAADRTAERRKESGALVLRLSPQRGPGLLFSLVLSGGTRVWGH